MRLRCSAWLMTAAALTLAACSPPRAEPSPQTAPQGPAPKAATKGTIGVSLLTMSNPFFMDMGEAISAAAKDQGYEVILTAGDNDPAKQKDQVQDFITKAVAAIVLCPCDSRSVGATIAEANKAGIPVFTADIANLDKTGEVVCHVATDNHAGGVLAGQTVVDVLAGKGEVAIIDHPEVESVIQRTKGFHEVVDKAGGIKVVDQLPGKGARDESYKTAQDILEKHPNLAAIFAINDPSALGAVAAIEKAGRQGKVKVIGFDGMPEAKQAVKDGKIYADIMQDPKLIGSTVVTQIVDYLGGKTVPPEVLIPTTVYKQADAQADGTLK